MRLVALALLAGCDGVLGLVDITPKQYFDASPDAAGPCGAFAAIDRVPFAMYVVALNDFNVDPSETFATVFGQVGSSGTKMTHVLMQTAGGWDFDAARDSLPYDLLSARIASEGELFAATPQASTLPPYDLVEWTYGTAWTGGEYVDAGSAFDAYPTGYSKLPGGTELLVEVQHRAGVDNVMLVRTGPSWTVQPQNAISQAGNTSAAALTSDGLVMVYAAAPSGQATGSRLYMSRRTDLGAEFPVGTPIRLDGSGEDVEPALAGDCSHLYFRRDSTIYVAR